MTLVNAYCSGLKPQISLRCYTIKRTGEITLSINLTVILTFFPSSFPTSILKFHKVYLVSYTNNMYSVEFRLVQFDLRDPVTKTLCTDLFGLALFDFQQSSALLYVRRCAQLRRSVSIHWQWHKHDAKLVCKLKHGYA